MTPERPGVLIHAIWIWVVLFAGGLWLVSWHARLLQDGKREQFVALKTLQANHRIVDGDIAEAGLWHPFLLATLTTRDDFDGRYVEQCVDDQEPIEIEKTLRGPKLSAKPRNAIVWISLNDLPPADIATLDVHRTLDVCNIDGKETCGTYAVEAIACSGKETAATTCSAGVQITTEQRHRLFLALDKDESTPAPSASPAPAPSPGPAETPGRTRKASQIRLMIHRSEVGGDGRAETRCPTPAPTSKPSRTPTP